MILENFTSNFEISFDKFDVKRRVNPKLTIASFF